MSKRGAAGRRFDVASYRLAGLISSGYLLACTDPAGFLERVAAEIEKLRALVEDAYREGWEDAIRDVDTFNHADEVLEKSWKESEARQAVINTGDTRNAQTD